MMVNHWYIIANSGTDLLEVGTIYVWPIFQASISGNILTDKKKHIPLWKDFLCFLGGKWLETLVENITGPAGTDLCSPQAHWMDLLSLEMTQRRSEGLPPGLSENSYWCVVRREFSGMIHWRIINNHPSNPQQPIHSLRKTHQ